MAARISRDPDVVGAYLTDASNTHGWADAVVRPRSTAEVAEVLAGCQAQGVPVTVVASQTSTTGSSVPEGGWVLSMEHLDGIERIEDARAVAQGGVLLGRLQDEIEARGRFLPPDPTSRQSCTLGGAIACNASGARSFRYGSMRRWVEALEVVLPTGQVVEVRAGDPVPSDWPVPAWTGPPVKNAAGYGGTGSLLDLFVGQEGTLGVITRATVRLMALPASWFGVVAWFGAPSGAVAFAQHARAAARSDRDGPLSPRCIEYLDAHCLDLARQGVATVPPQARAALFCEQEVVPQHTEAAHLEAWWQALSDAGALVEETLVTTDPEGQARLHAFRHAIPAGINEQVVANGMPKVGTDLAVPDAALTEMMEAYARAPVPHVLFGHIGDNHLHLNLLPRNAAELARARDFYDELAARAVALGGTISAEHGVGKLKRAQFEQMVPPAVLAQYRALKAHLDPNWILGRGNILTP